MNVKIEKSNIKGMVIAPPSKSYAHRALICAAFSDGICKIDNVEWTDDFKATVSCIESLGIKTIKEKTSITIEGIANKLDKINNESTYIFDCNECGSTYRFFIPIAVALGIKSKFIGTKKLLSRPINIYEEIFNKQNINYKIDKDNLLLDGSFSKYDFNVLGNVSSQFITGLIFAIVISGKDGKIVVKKPVESIPYIDLTIDMLKHFGVVVTKDETSQDAITYEIKAHQMLQHNDYVIEGDYSNASFFEAMNMFGDVSITMLNEKSLQGDKKYLEYFSKIKNGFCKIDISNTPDLAPILFVYALLNKGAHFVGTKRLKIKESDRANAMKEELEKCGADIEVYDDEVIVKESILHAPNTIINAHNDHRVVMAMTVLGLKIGNMIIENKNAVNKSFPSFFEKVKGLGGIINEMDS